MIAEMLAAAVAASAIQFDLICEGVSNVDRSAPAPFTARYSFDLQAKRYCLTPCESPDELIVTADDLKLRPGGTGADDFATIDRNTGHYRSLATVRAVNSVIIDDADCKKAPFSGFPRRRF